MLIGDQVEVQEGRIQISAKRRKTGLDWVSHMQHSTFAI